MEVSALKMDPEKKRLWVEALRSGDYQQGKEALRSRDDNYCCLGVLCELAINAGHGCWDIDEEDSNFKYVSPDGNLSDDFPSVSVMDWAGFGLAPGAKCVVDPLIKKEDGALISLSNLNDGGSSFAEIADLIEVQL